ncbi:hypothetical protein ACL2DZ_08440 (plasmid) [Sinorhizobium meliloti]
MSIPNSAEAHPRAPSQPLTDTLPRWLRGRRGLALLVALVLGLGAAFNWNWLVAAGVAPLLLSVIPCLAMCALGLCMGRMTGTRNGASSTGNSRTEAATGSMDTPTSCCSSERSARTTAADER